MSSYYVSCWIGFLVISMVAWAFFCGTFAAHRGVLTDVTPERERRHPALVAELVLYGVAGSVSFILSCCCFHICMREDKHVFSMFMQDLCAGVKEQTASAMDAPRAPRPPAPSSGSGSSGKADAAQAAVEGGGWW